LDAVLSYAIAPEDDFEGTVGFVSFESAYYPQFAAYYERQAQEWARRQTEQHGPDETEGE
jgi:hypothetical protein